MKIFLVNQTPAVWKNISGHIKKRNYRKGIFRKFKFLNFCFFNDYIVYMYISLKEHFGGWFNNGNLS